jgi:hypothetical protein
MLDIDKFKMMYDYFRIAAWSKQESLLDDFCICNISVTLVTLRLCFRILCSTYKEVVSKTLWNDSAFGLLAKGE